MLRFYTQPVEEPFGYVSNTRYTGEPIANEGKLSRLTRHQPKTRSTMAPTCRKPIMFSAKWITPACKNIAAAENQDEQDEAVAVEGQYPKPQHKTGGQNKRERGRGHGRDSG